MRNVLNYVDQPLEDGDNVVNLNGTVKIKTKNVTDDLSFDAVVTATIAEINAGKTLIDGISGKKIRVVDFTALVTGNWAVATSVDLQDNSSSPVKIGVMLIASLTDGAVVKPNSANVTAGAGFLADLAEGKAVRVVNVGTAGTTGTSIKFAIKYQVV